MLITILSQKSDSINTPLPSIWKFMKYFYFSQSKGGKPVPAALSRKDCLLFNYSVIFESAMLLHRQRRVCRPCSYQRSQTTACLFRQ